MHPNPSIAILATLLVAVPGNAQRPTPPRLPPLLPPVKRVERPSQPQPGARPAAPTDASARGSAPSPDAFIRDLGHLPESAEPPVPALPTPYLLESWLDAAGSTPWPGALLQGGSLLRSDVAEISVSGPARSPIEVTIAGIANGGKSGKLVAHPSVLTVRDAVRETVADAGSLAGNRDVNIATATSLDEGLLKVGVKASAFGQSVSSDLERGWDGRHSYVVVLYRQAYFTASVPSPASPAAWIVDPAAFDAAKRYMGKGNPPVFVDHVDYGRLLLLVLESDWDQTTLRAAVESHFSAFGAKLTTKTDVTRKLTDIVTSVRGRAIGGPALALDSDPATCLANAVKWLQTGLTWQPNRTSAEPISFGCRYLADNTVVKVRFKARAAGPLMTWARVSYMCEDFDKEKGVLPFLSIGQSDLQSTRDIPGMQQTFDTPRARALWRSDRFGGSFTFRLPAPMPLGAFQDLSLRAGIIGGHENGWEFRFRFEVFERKPASDADVGVQLLGYYDPFEPQGVYFNADPDDHDEAAFRVSDDHPDTPWIPINARRRLAGR